MLKTIILLTISSMALSGSGASGCRANRSANQEPVIAKTTPDAPELKILAEGFHSSITHSFVAVLRDAETYSTLTKLDASLPKLNEEFFKTHIVIAAFLGERNTGGYGIQITRESAGGFDSQPKSFIRVAEVSPGKGMMVPQVITSPFKVVSIEVKPTDNVLLALDETWRKTSQPYRVTRGSFTMSGGFAGVTDQFEVGGNVHVAREGNLATFAFMILRPGAGAQHSLSDFTTGVVTADGQVTINKMSAGSFVKPPNGGLSAIGAFTADQDTLSLRFSSLPFMVADGYAGSGTIEAVKVTPEPSSGR
jgi:hypothetical protein